MKDVARHFGRLDILVNNAGVAVGGAVDDANTDTAALARQDADQCARRDHRDPHRVKTDGRRRPHRHHRLGHRHPRLVPGPCRLRRHQGCVVGYTKGAARDLGPRGITVNVLQPGSIDTDMNPEGRPRVRRSATQAARAAALRHRRRDRRRRRLPCQPRSLLRDRHGAQCRRRIRRLIPTNSRSRVQSHAASSR